MAQLMATVAQQKDNLCGPFCAARILTGAGFAHVDQDVVASRAGTTLPPPGDEPSVPSGARSRTDYRLEFAVVPDRESGTTAAGLMRAIEALSGGAFSCVPVRGEWDAARVEGLVEQGPALGARLIANVRTGKLWGSHPPVASLLDELVGRAVEGPAADWDVGHFIELVMLVRGPRASLVVVHDTYPTLGIDGRHLQPPRVMASALLRGDGREGGVLAVVRPREAAAVSHLVKELGLEIGIWNNGSRSD